MDKNYYYNRQHVSTQDMNRMYIDFEEELKKHLLDFHVDTENLVLSGLNVTAMATPSLSLNVLAGTAYRYSRRIRLAIPEVTTVTSLPVLSVPTTGVIRIDSVFLSYTATLTSSGNVSFKDRVGNITTRYIARRKNDSYTITYAEGTPDETTPVPPSMPLDAIRLANIHLRKDTAVITDTNNNVSTEGYIEDTRPI